MRDLFLYTLAVAYLVLGAATILMILALAVLWIRYWIFRLFPSRVKRWRQRRKERLIDKYLRSFDE